MIFVAFLIIYVPKIQQNAAALPRKQKKSCFYLFKRAEYTTFACPKCFLQILHMQIHMQAMQTYGK